MDLSIPHQISHSKCDIKDFTKMVDEFRRKNIAIEYYRKLFPYYLDICLEQKKSSNEEILL